MAMEELEKLLAEGGDNNTENALGDKKPEEKKDEEVLKKEQQLANLQKAIAEANAQLKESRKAKPKTEEDEDLPRIDMEDPSSKAWDKHFSSKVNPLQEELEKEKSEIRTFALQEFIGAHPNLASSPDKLKKVVATYERIRTASERTKEGVLIDLRKAYAAEFSEELLQERNSDRFAIAQGDAIFSDPAISRGSSSYREEREKNPRLSNEDLAILAKWGMAPEDYIKMVKAQEKKS